MTTDRVTSGFNTNKTAGQMTRTITMRSIVKSAN